MCGLSLYRGVLSWKHAAHAQHKACELVQLVTKLSMISRDVGAVSYRMRGNIASVPVDIDFEDIFELNLLTGRVLKHT